MYRLDVEEHMETYETLKEKYAEKHRHYHTLEHINSCLALLSENRHLASYPNEVELAIWFHDAVYNIFSSTNERDSAAMASEFVINAGLEAEVAKRVSELVMATQHGTPLTSLDQAFIVDVDLSILGCIPPSYKAFELAIRREYKSVPLILFKRGRKKILNSFLNRKRIFYFPEFYEKYEAQARENMTKAVTAM